MITARSNRATWSAALLLAAIMSTIAFSSIAKAEGMSASKPAKPAPGQRDGQVHSLADGQFLAWDADIELWVEPVTFWESYAARRGGITFGWSFEYPAYEKAREFDTLMIQVDSGPCLMEFFHERWRRANDVRRWGPEFNEFGGCADVFK